MSEILDKTRQELLDHLIEYKSDNTQLAYLYDCIMDNIKNHKTDIDEPVDHKQIDIDEWDPVFSKDYTKYLDIKKLIEEFKEANKELLFDYSKKIDTLLVELISELFPHMTDKIFSSLNNKVVVFLNTKMASGHIKTKREHLFLGYISELKAEAKRISQPHIKKELPIDTTPQSQEPIKDADILHDIKSKLEELEDLYNINNIGELTVALIAKKTALDTLFDETSETAKKMTGDYETLTKQWVVQDFKSKADELEKQREGYAKWYVGMIFISIGIIIVCVLLNIFGLPKFFGKPLTFWEHFSTGVLLTTPVVATLFWLTRYFNRRVHELIHLKEDYEHKYLAMLVFDGFKETVKSYDENAAHEYLMKVISTITENPTHCLSRKKTDKSPMTEAIELVKSVSSIKPLM